MTRTLAAVAVLAVLALPGCKGGKASVEDKLEKTVQSETAILAKIEGIKARQIALAEKQAAYEARLVQVRNKRQQLEQQIGRRTPQVIRPGDPSS